MQFCTSQHSYPVPLMSNAKWNYMYDNTTNHYFLGEYFKIWGKNTPAIMGCLLTRKVLKKRCDCRGILELSHAISENCKRGIFVTVRDTREWVVAFMVFLRIHTFILQNKLNLLRGLALRPYKHASHSHSATQLFCGPWFIVRLQLSIIGMPYLFDSLWIKLAWNWSPRCRSPVVMATPKSASRGPRFTEFHHRVRWRRYTRNDTKKRRPCLRSTCHCQRRIGLDLEFCR